MNNTGLRIRSECLLYSDIWIHLKSPEKLSKLIPSSLYTLSMIPCVMAHYPLVTIFIFSYLYYHLYIIKTADINIPSFQQ